MNSVFRCDYCGELTDTRKGVIYWTEVEQLDNGDVLNVPATYCGDYCGRRATSQAGTGRG